MSMRAPTGVTATQDLTDKITVSWNAVSGATSYSLYAGTTPDSGSASLVASGITGTSHDDSATGYETIKYYWLKAVGGAGTSIFSGMGTGWRVAAIPDAPEDLEASSDVVGEIDLTWSASDRALFYQIWRSETDDPDAAIYIGQTVETSYADTDLDTATSHFYFVKAGNYTGLSAFSDSAEGYAAGLGAPTGVGATTDESYDSVTVTGDEVEGATSYSVYKEGSLIASGLTDPTYDDGDAEVGITRHYQMSAVNAYEESALSSSVTGRRLRIDAPEIEATTVLADEIQVSWGAVDGATRYDVYVDGSVFAFDVTSTYSVTGLDPCTEYSITVRALREVGDGNNANMSDAVTGRMYQSDNVCIDDGINEAGGGGGYDQEFAFCGGSLSIFFDAATIKDAMNVYVDGSLVWNTGCISGSASTLLSTSLGSHTIRFEVIPNCETGGATSWTFSVSCE